MNSNTAEEKIRMKVEPMSTLQAGIVYGHEEAWDKLQARLDAKPARKVLPWYKVMAAAAALLLLCGTGYLLLRDNDTVTQQPDNGTLPTTESPLSQTPATDHRVATLQDTYTHITVRTAPIHHHHQPQPVQQVDEPTPVVLPEVTYSPEPKVQPTPAPKMKVVHINELGQQEENTAHYAWEEKNPFPHIQFRMKVVHINDIGRPLRQEDYMRTIERTTVWRLPFGHKNSMYNANEQPGSLFRINLSTNRNNEKATFNTGTDMGTDSTEPVVY